MKTLNAVQKTSFSINFIGEVYGSIQYRCSQSLLCHPACKQQWQSRPPPDEKSKEGKSKTGFKVTILDIFIGAGLATVQSIWNTPMLAWVVGWLHMLGLPVLPLWETNLLATFVISIVLCTLTPVVRWLLKKLFS